jgi:CheY-like chemotaxis protein
VIARRLVEAMGGSLTLSSMPSSGTRVRIALPAAAATAGAPQELASKPRVHAAETASISHRTEGAGHTTAAGTARVLDPALPVRTRGVRMLYVEDNRINAILFEEAVRVRGGIDLQVAEDGAEALALVAQWLPEVLVLDANLPDMSGYEVLMRLRKIPALASVPAFMCSADAMEADKQRAAAAGFLGYWTKPIDIGRVMRDLDHLRLCLPAA